MGCHYGTTPASRSPSRRDATTSPATGVTVSTVAPARQFKSGSRSPQGKGFAKGRLSLPGGSFGAGGMTSKISTVNWNARRLADVIIWSYSVALENHREPTEPATAKLTVHDLDSGGELLNLDVPTKQSTLSANRLAFNADGSRLALFGATQR